MKRLSHSYVLLAIAATLGLAACKKNKPEKAAPAASASAASAAATASAAPAASASAAPKAVANAKTEINGKSMSVAKESDIEAAMKKAGWHFIGSGGMTMGSMQTITVKAKKGHLEAHISLVRPSGKKDTGSSMKMASAKSQQADFAKKGATLLDGNALLAVVIKGKKDDAKKLLDALVKK